MSSSQPKAAAQRRRVWATAAREHPWFGFASQMRGSSDGVD